MEVDDSTVERGPAPVRRSRTGRVLLVVAGLLLAAVALACVLAFGAVTIALLGMSQSGNRIDSGLAVDNRTDDELTIVYEPRRPTAREGPYITRPGQAGIGVLAVVRARSSEITTMPSLTRDGCTVGPVVARRADGSEVARLAEGACVYHQLVEWQIG